MEELRNCELLSIATFYGNKFNVRYNGVEYKCACADPETDWDKLYDHLTKPIDLGIVCKVGDRLIVKIL